MKRGAASQRQDRCDRETEAVEDSQRDGRQEVVWDLRLYVAGPTPKCMYGW